MTTDDFTTAARAEARDAWDFQLNPESSTPEEDLGQHMAEWARTYLAEQEVSDAEVEAAARALLPHITPDAEEDAHPDAIDDAWNYARAALTAARAVGRDAR